MKWRDVTLTYCWWLLVIRLSKACFQLSSAVDLLPVYEIKSYRWHFPPPLSISVLLGNWLKMCSGFYDWFYFSSWGMHATPCFTKAKWNNPMNLKDTSSSQSITPSVKAVQFSSFPFPLEFLPPILDLSLPSVCSLITLVLCCQVRLTFLAHRFFFPAVVCCVSVMSSVPNTVIFLVTAYPFQIPFLSLPLQISVVPPSHKELSSLQASAVFH